MLWKPNSLFCQSGEQWKSEQHYIRVLPGVSSWCGGDVFLRAETLERTPDCHVTLCKHVQLGCCVLIQRLAFNSGHQRCGFQWLMMWYGPAQLGSCSLGSIAIELRLNAKSQLISEVWWSWSKGHGEGIEAFKVEISLDYTTFNEILQKMFSFWGYFYLVYFSPSFSTKWGWWLRANPVLYLL